MLSLFQKGLFPSPIYATKSFRTLLAGFLVLHLLKCDTILNVITFGKYEDDFSMESSYNLCMGHIIKGKWLWEKQKQETMTHPLHISIFQSLQIWGSLCQVFQIPFASSAKWNDWQAYIKTTPTVLTKSHNLSGDLKKIYPNVASKMCSIDLSGF